MPKHIIKSINIQPLSGKVCNMLVWGGSCVIRAEYLLTILRKMKRNAIRVTMVIGSNQHNSIWGITLYAITPLMAMMTPGIPHIVAAVR